MHSALSVASLLLAASSTFAYPQVSNSTSSVSTSSYTADTEVRAILSSQSTETGSQTSFKKVDVRKNKAPVGSPGPFETIEINVGADAQQDLRCQALGLDGKPLIATRGDNVDITFSDADKGAWTFVQPSEVSRLICDPAFVAAPAGSFDIRVTLQNQAIELGSGTVLKNAFERVTATPVGSSGPFDTVEVTVGALLDPAIRCKLKNLRGRQIVATRGENVDVTFSDADKGPWDFEKEQKVGTIICDPTFVARPQ